MKPTPDDEEGEVADAAFLFQDRTETPAPEGRASASDPGAGYDLGGEEEPRKPAVPPPLDFLTPPKPAASPRARPRKPAPEPDAEVDEVWSRWGEWGPDLIRVGLAALGAGFLVFVATELGLYSLAFFLLVAGGAALAVLSYPMMITLERPVRVTPEQAVRDYFAALSHLRPHYRRMWLLLSTPGKEAPAFGSFEAFRAYWEGQIARLTGPDPGRFNPLDFEVESFHAEKSAGLTSLVAEFTVRVVRRGGGVVESHPRTIGLVRGPDRMWYLNRGELSS